MQRKNSILAVLLILPVMLGCSFATLVASTPASNTAATLPAAQPLANLAALETEARTMVAGFLGALQNSSEGVGADAFLSDGLRQSIAAGSNPAQLLGMTTPVTAFQLSAVTFSADAASAVVDATVEFPQPVNARFQLSRLSGRWVIDQITLLQGADDYPATPEQVVMAFLTAYQETPDQMSRFLSAQRLAQLPPGGAVAMLDLSGALEGSMIESAAVSMNPPSAVVQMSIQAGGQIVSRRFTLLQDGSIWKIDTVDAP